jgi:signal peptidase I
MTSPKDLWQRTRAAIRQALPPSLRRHIADAAIWVKEPAITLGLVLLATTAVARPFYVPSGSMEPTLQIGDDLLAAKYAYGYSRYSLPFGIGPSSTQRFLGRLPARGDVVVFRLPRDPSQTYVKRVIGLPGDRLQMIGGRLWINGKELPLKPDGQGQVEGEDGTIASVPRFIETLPNGSTHPILKWTWSGPYDDTSVYVVPKDHLFMMGDNRDNSLDSRVPPEDGGVGYVPMENLIGRAEVVMGSVDFLNAPSLLAWPAEFRLSRLFESVR